MQRLWRRLSFGRSVFSMHGSVALLVSAQIALLSWCVLVSDLGQLSDGVYSCS